MSKKRRKHLFSAGKEPSDIILVDMCTYYVMEKPRYVNSGMKAFTDSFSMVSEHEHMYTHFGGQ